MSRQFFTLVATAFAVLILVLAVPLPTFASGGTPQIELSVSQASPGATIEVNGGRFEPDAVVTLLLHRPESQVPLGKVIADDHGEFTSAILLPADLPYGHYEFRAVDEHNHIAMAVLTIAPDTNGEEENSQRGEEEPLLAPMPTPAAGTGQPSAAPVVNTAAPHTPIAAEPPIPTTVLFVSALTIIILVTGLVVILRRFR